MKKIFFFFALIVRIDTQAQSYWQQEVHYVIHVALNDTTHSLKGSETIEYINHSPDTLSYLWFHLWPNAYKDQSTALYKQLVMLGQKSFDAFKDNGYIDSLRFTANDKAITTVKDSVGNIDIIKLLLPSPLLPGGKIIIATPFFVKIPPYFSRLGYEGQTYMISQWYPKPAVYDHDGWHPMPYLDQGEFYSEYGSFEVNITVPSGYVVGATGSLEIAAELSQYRDIGKKNLTTRGNTKYQSNKQENVKTLQYYADSVHDFAWFADKNFIINYDTLQLPSGKIIDVFSYHLPNGNSEWVNSISFIKDAVLHYSAWIGEYGYPVVSAIEGPDNSSAGGMEYPMITLISLPGLRQKREANKILDDVIAHEVGHNWFYGILGTNERDHPWMDEGINSYYEFRYEAEKYRYNSLFSLIDQQRLKKMSTDDFLSVLYGSINETKIDEEIETPAAAFTSESDYASIEYNKAALWMYVMEKTIGKSNLDKGVRAYFNDWKFKHPYPEDMQKSMERATGIGLKNMFDLLYHRGSFN